MNKYPDPVQRTREDIYTNYILPIIRQAQTGDELLYVSTTTFFGYWSLGAHIFDEVAKALEEAKDRGVRIRLIVKVHNIFTAIAGEWLLKFLIDNEETRNLAGDTTSFYYIMTYRPSDKTGKFVEFNSDIYSAEEYLPEYNIRTFHKKIGSMTELDTETASARRNQFMYLWENDANSLKEAVAQFKERYFYENNFHRQSGLRINPLILSFLVVITFTLGLLLGLITAFQEQIKNTFVAISLAIFLSFIIGIVVNVVSDRIISRYKN